MSEETTCDFDRGPRNSNVPGSYNSETMQYGKKKKKRSFLQRQKRFAKNGSFGRGSQLSQDMYEYFINILKVMNSKKDDEEEMSILASSVFREMEGKESEYCCNQLVSRVIEDLLPYSTNEEFSEFIEKFSENLRPIFCDAFGSHVLQQTLVVAYKKYQECLSSQSDNKFCLKFHNYILKISNFLFNNLEDFIWDIYSNAVSRTVFNVLGGSPVKGELKPGLGGEVKDENDAKVPHEFYNLVKKYAERIVSWPQFKDLCNQPVNSNFLQSLLLACKKFDEGDKMVDKIITFYEDSPLDLAEEENNPFVRLLEVVLSVANEKSFKRIYKHIFKDKLKELAVSKSGNFAVQKLILNCKNVEIFEKIFAKLAPHMEEVLAVEHSGVILAVVKSCRNLGVLQGDCMATLTRAFQAKDTKELVPLLISLTPLSSRSSSDTLPVALHGCLIVQELLNFKKPIAVVHGLLELPEQQLVKLLCDVKGSHITDAFVQSTTIGEKSRDRLFKTLRGHYLELATSKHGSRSLDAIWSVISIQQKALLAEELKLKESELCSSIYGKGFAKKIHLGNFRRDKEGWIKLQRTSLNAEKYFSDIIPKKRQKTS